MSDPAYLPMLMVPLMAFAVYRRVRRNIGAQLLRPSQLKFRIGLLAVVLAMLALLSLQSLPMATAISGGVLVGAMLGFVGMRLTRFETRADGVYYTPNVYLGVALSLLVLARVVYRMSMLWSQGAAQAAHPGPPQFSPLTFALVAVLIGYYLVYCIGILRHPHANLPAIANPAADRSQP